MKFTAFAKNKNFVKIDSDRVRVIQLITALCIVKN